MLQAKKEPVLKRWFDFSLALFGILVSLPVCFLITLAIYLEDRGPIFYLKKSIGKGGRIFYVIKFRSMIPYADRKIHLSFFEEDSRLTKVGKILRPMAMDELPQLINILKGEMSFVGPRAYAIERYGISRETADIKEQIILPEKVEFFKRTSVTPGLTGAEQVAMVNLYKHFIDDPTGKTVLDHDLFYIENQNFYLDLKLIFLSFLITFKRKWEIAGRKHWVNC